MIRLGIIGLGTEWESRYNAALGRLRNRTQVRAVFDPVIGKAEQAAPELNAAVETGMLSLVRRNDIDALLLLDAAWYGCEALRLLCSEGKPVFIAAELEEDPSVLRALHWTAVNDGLTLMPELRLRYTPASSRLQELMATCLGRPRRVSVEIDGGATACRTRESSQGVVIPATSGKQCHIPPRILLNWFDWMRYVARAAPRRVSMEPRQAGAGEGNRSHTILLEFALPRESRTTMQAQLQFRTSDAEAPGSNNPVGEHGGEHAGAQRRPTTRPTPLPCGRQEVVCEHGTALIESPTVIRWQTDADSAEETLSADRNETEVMLDHFCRRVVGGLIPVADLSDISHGLELIHAAVESLRSGRPVLLNGSATE